MSLPMTPERTIQDVLDAINSFANYTEEKFTQMDSRFAKMESEISQIKSTMVTKDYLDKRLYELRDELLLISRKTNTKLTVLIETLVTQKLIEPSIANKILALEPFPQA